MADWLEQLKGLVQATAENLIKLTVDSDVTANNNNKTNSDNKTNSENDVAQVNIGHVENMLNLQLKLPESGQLDESTLRGLREVFLPLFEQNDLYTLQDDSKKLLSGHKAFREEPDVREVLNFFDGKISQADLILVESGLYEDYLLRHEQVDLARSVKSGVQPRYGSRGLNIVNLASRGYFLTHIKPLYQALDELGRLNEFDDEYKKIVDDLPFAIFVAHGMTEEVLLATFEEKAERNRRYGVEHETITISGFGSTATTIEALVPQLERKYEKVITKVETLGTLKSFQATVFYKDIKED